MTDQKVPEWVHRTRAAEGLPPLDQEQSDTIDLRFTMLERSWMYEVLCSLDTGHPGRRSEMGEAMRQHFLTRFALSSAQPQGDNKPMNDGNVEKKCDSHNPVHWNNRCVLVPGHPGDHANDLGGHWGAAETDYDLPLSCAIRACENKPAPRVGAILCMQHESDVAKTLRGTIHIPGRLVGSECTEVHPDHPNVVCSRHAAHIIPHKSAGGLEWPPAVLLCRAPRPAAMDQECELPRGHEGYHRATIWTGIEEQRLWEDPCSAVSPDGFGTCSRPPGHPGEHQRWSPQGVPIARWQVFEPDCWAESWCPQCGPDVSVDEDGACNSCGSTAIGEGAERAAKLAKAFEALLPIVKGVSRA